MNWDEVQGQWKQFKGRVREKWGKLTDDDLEQVMGKKDRLLGVIQERYGVAKEEASSLVDGFLAGLKPDSPAARTPGDSAARKTRDRRSTPDKSRDNS